MATDANGNWKPDGDGFKRISKEELEKPGGECAAEKADHHPAKCDGCHMTVIIHCHDCGIQITGCICLLFDQFGGSDGVEFMRQVENLKAKGISLPKGLDPRAPFDPNRLH